MVGFEDFWNLVKGRGHVAHFYRLECEALWKNYTPAQQQAICDAIERKIRRGAFVHFVPTKAMQDNAPKQEIISYDEHYRRFGTDVPQNGWQRVHLPEQQKTIYIKQL